MTKVRVLLALGLVAALVVAAAATDLGGGAATTPRSPSRGAELGANVALLASAREPARTIAPMLRRLATASDSPAFARAVTRTRAAIARAGVDARRDLLAPLSSVVISLERACPPPALLACRPAIRISGRLRGEPAVDLGRSLRVALVAGLRAAGMRRMTVRVSSPGALSGRVISRGETLARWSLAGGVLEVATGGLGLREKAAPPASPPSAGSAIRVEVDESTLSGLL